MEEFAQFLSSARLMMSGKVMWIILGSFEKFRNRNRVQAISRQHSINKWLIPISNVLGISEAIESKAYRDIEISSSSF